MDDDLDRSISELRDDPYGTRARLEKFAGLLNGHGEHLGISALADRITQVESRQVHQYVDSKARIEELERRVRDLRELAGTAIVCAIVLGINAEFGRESLRQVLWVASIAGLGFLILRSLYRFVTRKPEPSPEP